MPASVSFFSKPSGTRPHDFSAARVCRIVTAHSSVTYSARMLTKVCSMKVACRDMGRTARTGEAAEDEGMVCGGIMDVLVEDFTTDREPCDR